MDIETIQDLYIQAKKSKQILFELLFQLANPDAANENPLQLQDVHHQDEYEMENDQQAAMIRSLANGMQQMNE